MTRAGGCGLDDWVCAAALLCEKSSHFRLCGVPDAALAIAARVVLVRPGEPRTKRPIKKSLTAGGHASRAPLDAREGTMSFHVVRHERANIFVLNRQTYETYRFTIGHDVAVAHVGPPSDLSKARRAAIAFLAQSEKGARPVQPRIPAV
jgi:hypothetical protein